MAGGVAIQKAADGSWVRPVKKTPGLEARSQLFAIERRTQQMALEREVLADGAEARELASAQAGENLAWAALAHGWADGARRTDKGVVRECTRNP